LRKHPVPSDARHFNLAIKDLPIAAFIPEASVAKAAAAP